MTGYNALVEALIGTPNWPGLFVELTLAACAWAFATGPD